jgi:hypothetical protein
VLSKADIATITDSGIASFVGERFVGSQSPFATLQETKQPLAVSSVRVFTSTAFVSMGSDWWQNPESALAGNPSTGALGQATGYSDYPKRSNEATIAAESHRARAQDWGLVAGNPRFKGMHRRIGACQPKETQDGRSYVIGHLYAFIGIYANLAAFIQLRSGTCNYAGRSRTTVRTAFDNVGRRSSAADAALLPRQVTCTS